MAINVGDTVDPKDIVQANGPSGSLIGTTVDPSDIVPDAPPIPPPAAASAPAAPAGPPNYLDILKALITGSAGTPLTKAAGIIKDVATRNTQDPMAAALVHAGNSATLGQLPNLAGVESGITGQGFTNGKQSEQNYIDALTANNKNASAVGDVVGSTAPYLLLPEAALPAKMLMSGGLGAVQGAAEGIHDDDTMNGVLTKMAEGGLGAAAGEGIASGIGGAATKYAPQVVGGQKSILKTISPDARADLGHYLLNTPEGGGEQVITPFAGSETMTDRNDRNLLSSGQTKGGIEAKADALGNNFDTSSALSDVDSLRPIVPDAPIYKSANTAVNNSVDDLLKHADQLGDSSGNLSLTDAAKLKTAYGDATDWTHGVAPVESLPNNVNKNVYSIIKDYIEKGILPEDVPAYNQANETYRNAKNAKTALGNLQVGEQGNNVIGLASKIGLASGHPGAIPAALGLELANRRLPSAAVYAADRLGNKAPGVISGLTSQTVLSKHDPINEYLNQTQPGHPDQQGAEDDNQ